MNQNPQVNVQTPAARTSATQALILAHSDAEAVLRFLNQASTDGGQKFAKATRAAYEKECRRLLWFCQSHQLQLARLSLEQAQAFIQLLSDPPHHLIGRAKRPFGTADWKPFVVSRNWQPGQPVLSAASIHQAIAAVKSLMAWLQKVGYLTLNPFALIDTNTQEKQRIAMTRKHRVLHLDDIASVVTYLQQTTAGSADQTKSTQNKQNRQRWLFYAYLYSGLRISELLTNDTRSLQRTVIKGRSYWLLHIIGKGGKPAEIPVSQGFINELSRYRSSLGLPATPSSQKPEPFFYNLNGTRALTTRQKLHSVFKELISEVAEHLHTQGKPEDSARLRASSVHWLRHSFVTLALDETHDMAAVMELARHSDIKTTMGYDQSQVSHLADVLEQLDRKLGSLCD